MRTRLPPLTALRAFEAAARLDSFSKAADDLFVTPAAISQQIKQLEEHLGLRLFERTNKGVKITEAGEQYHAMVFSAFEMLRKATQRISSYRARDQLVISLLPSLASQWLGGRLMQWYLEYPDSQIAIVATHPDPDFEFGEPHLRIGYGFLRQRGVVCEELLVDRVCPVCSPDLIADRQSPLTPQDITDYPLIHIDWGNDNDSLPSWKQWFEAADITLKDPSGGPTFNLSSMAIQAAIEGKGFVLGQDTMVQQDIDSGRLIRPVDLSLPLSDPYFLAYPESAKEHPHFEPFCTWLRKVIVEAKAE